MAGSLSHIVEDDGTFTMDYIENMGDAHEALEECFYIIKDLVGTDFEKLNKVLEMRNYPALERPMQ